MKFLLMPWILLAVVIVAAVVIYYLMHKPQQQATVTAGVADVVSLVKRFAGSTSTQPYDPDAAMNPTYF